MRLPAIALATVVVFRHGLEGVLDLGVDQTRVGQLKLFKPFLFSVRICSPSKL
jgi:hypothetical protein